jgi:hypothetical protein
VNFQHSTDKLAILQTASDGFPIGKKEKKIVEEREEEEAKKTLTSSSRRKT